MKTFRFGLALLLTLSVPSLGQVTAPPSTINFQGRLATSSGNPVADGTYSVRFRFYDTATAGNVLYEKTIASVQVKNGTFAVSLDAIGAAAFNGNAWIGVKIGTDAELTPRQQIVSVPYALKSNLALTVPDSSITNTKIAAGTLTADRFASGVLNSNVWLLGGNSATNPANHFLGTTDAQPLVVKTNNAERMRVLSNGNIGIGTASPTHALDVNGNIRSRGGDFVLNGRGGGFGNSGGAGRALVDDGTGATTGGGLIINFSNDFGKVKVDSGLEVFGQLSLLAGGLRFPDGSVQTTATDANTRWSLSGNAGTDPNVNFIGTTDNQALVFRVNLNTGFRLVPAAVVNQNSSQLFTGTNLFGGTASTGTNAVGGTIAGGGYFNGSVHSNRIEGLGSTIGGGADNVAGATTFELYNSAFATVGGGEDNRALGAHATVPGGSHNRANGWGSFAAGSYAVAGDGCFVWADNSSTANFTSTGSSQFLIRAAGGVGINTTAPLLGGLRVNGDIDGSNLFTGTVNCMGLFVNGADVVVRGRGGGQGNSGGAARALVDGGWPGSAGGVVSGGGLILNFANDFGRVLVDSNLRVNGSVHATNGYTSSDARFKTQIATLDHSLETLLKLRGVSYEWNRAKFPDRNFTDGRQIGFLAQEMEQILPELVVTDETGYKSVNYVGVIPVLVEAVKTQQTQLRDKQRQIDELKQQTAEIADLKAQIAALRELVEKQIQDRQ